MSWVLGLVGAFLGAAISDEEGLTGFLFGALLGWTLGALSKVRGRLSALERELAALHAAQAAASLAAATSAQAAPGALAPDAARAVTPEGLAPSVHAGVPPPGALPGVGTLGTSPASAHTTAAGPDAAAQLPTPPAGAIDAQGAPSLAAAAGAPVPPSMTGVSSAQVSPSVTGAQATSSVTGMQASSSVPGVSGAQVPGVLGASGARVTGASGPASPPGMPSGAGAGAPPSPPGWEARAAAAVKAWFTEGNVPVKLGVLVLFIGVAGALRYAASQGYLSVPVEVRLALIGAGGLAALWLGWRERERRPAFGLSLQGGGIGVLLLTVFAAFRLFSLLPAGAAFALVVVLVAGAAALSVLQRAQALATLGFVGGYLAPVLLSTGSGNHVALFSYYAVLNAAVFAISWKRSWRLLNLVGFAFTFAVGAAWGARAYRPEHLSTTEPFLVLFFAFYVAIGLLYVLRQAPARPFVDGTLVFGTPLLAFPLQAALLRGRPLALAFSALVVAVVYAGLVVVLHRRQAQRLLAEAYGALAITFATLAVPLAFSAGATASLWAVEGVGVAWLGLRQRRTVPWVAGLVLQLLAAGALLVSLTDHAAARGLLDAPLTNAHFLAAVLVAASGMALSLVHERVRPTPVLSLLLFLWGALWWAVAGLHELPAADRAGWGAWQWAMTFTAFTLVVAALLRQALAWGLQEWLAAAAAAVALVLVFVAADEYPGPLARATWAEWALYAGAAGAALYLLRASAGAGVAVLHLAVLWTVALAPSLQLHAWTGELQLAVGWRFAALWLPVGALTLALWRRPALAAWPRAGAFARARAGWFGPALVLLGVAWLVGVALEGDAAPLPYVPLLNPLELALVAIAALTAGYVHAEAPALRPLLRAWPFVGLAFLSLGTLRAVHHLHGEPWGEGLLASGFAQTALTLVWSVAGVTACFLGSQRRTRPLWVGGAALLGVVLLKLLLVDRHAMGTLEGIVSFLAVGLLLVGVGYFAPSPPKLAPAASDAPRGDA